MTYQTFPSLTATFPIELTPSFKTEITPYGDPVLQRLSRRRFATYTVNIPFGKLPLADRNSLYEFFINRQGSGESFWYVHNRSQLIVDRYMGYGTGAALTLDLGSKTTVIDATLKIYEDGVLQTKDTDYTFVSGGGEAGSDRITWLSGHYPATGALITMNCTGLMRILAYLGDEFNEKWVRHAHSETTLILYEDPNES